MIEYTGIDKDECSNTRPHGNTIYNGDPYRRCDKALLSKAASLREAHVPSRQIYRELTDVSSPSKGLMRSKQIYNAHSNAKRKQFGPSFGGSASEQALKAFRDMQLSPENEYGDFIQHFSCDKNGKPGIICFEPWQIEYTKKCCHFNPFTCSLIDEDKTYNITTFFLTHYAFLTPDFVQRRDPTIHPIIPGMHLIYPCSKLS